MKERKYMDTLGLARLLEALNEPCVCEFIGPRVLKIKGEFHHIPPHRSCRLAIDRWWQK